MITHIFAFMNQKLPDSSPPLPSFQGERLFGTTLNYLQRLPHIRFQIIDMLDADRESHEVGRNPSCLHLLLGHHSFPHRCCMYHKGIDATQTHRVRRQFQCRNEALSFFLAPFNGKGNDCCEPFHLTFCQLVLRMARKTWIIYTLYLWLLL